MAKDDCAMWLFVHGRQHEKLHRQLASVGFTQTCPNDIPLAYIDESPHVFMYQLNQYYGLN